MVVVQPITDDQLAEIKSGKWLPSDALANGWDDTVIADRWTGSFVTTTRQYWFERTQETARYLDLPDPGGALPITQLHRQAREMLDYWDTWIKQFGINISPVHSVRFGKIRRRYKNTNPYPVPITPVSGGPYNYTG